MSRVMTFCAGPCTLPTEVLAEVRNELSDFDDGGMRASIFNAMPDEGVDELAGFERDFAEAAG